MILKIVRHYEIDGTKEQSETFYEGKQIGNMTHPGGMVFSVDGQDELIVAPDEMDNYPRMDVYLMENGRTVERYHWGIDKR